MPDAIKPDTIQPDAARPGPEKPGFEKPGFEKPVFERPGFEKPGSEKPVSDKPGPERPDSLKPGALNVEPLKREEASADSAKRKKRVLGRGLDSLIPGFTPAPEPRRPDFFECRVDEIQPNRYQPRSRFSEEALDALAESIRRDGVLQPLLARRIDSGYELIAGERRLRAARKVGLDRVPVVIKDVSDTRLLELSIIENIQRQDLNPLEEADAYHLLMTAFDLTQEQVADRVGLKRATVTNYLRIRQLPDPIKQSLLDEVISMGHARALMGAETPALQLGAWQEVVAKGLSVRETEKLVAELKERRKRPEPPGPSSDDLYFMDLAENLSRRFGTRVRIQRRGKKGRLELEFYSDEDLDRLLEILNSR